MNRLFEQYKYNISKWDTNINSKNVNLQQEYNNLNQLIFDNKLPTITMKWNNNKSRSGLVQFRGRDRNTMKVSYLGISTYTVLTYRRFLSILCHEMIHVYVWLNKLKDNGSHGLIFKGEMNKINRLKLGFQISLKDNFENVKISPKNIKPRGVIFFKGPKGKTAKNAGIMVMSKAKLVSEEKYLKALLGNEDIFLVQNGITEISAMICSHAVLENYPLKKNFNHIKWYRLDVTLTQEIASKGKLLWEDTVENLRGYIMKPSLFGGLKK